MSEAPPETSPEASESWGEDSDQPPVKFETSELPETSLLKFASWVLVALLVLAILSGFAFGWSGTGQENHPTAVMFDAAKTILPPMATLVLTYYFAKRN